MSPFDDPHITPGEVAELLHQQAMPNPETYCALCPPYSSGVGVSSRNTIRQPAPRHPVSLTVNPSRVCCSPASMVGTSTTSTHTGSISGCHKSH
jgi:hypothetical protein